MDIYFLSCNKFKIKEVQNLLNCNEINILPAKLKINEIQSNDMFEIVRDKALKAFEKIGRPLIVEQTGLLIKSFGNLPGGLTQIFWDALQAENFCKYFYSNDSKSVEAKTVLAFCDGRTIKTFEGAIYGSISEQPKGNRDFQWDCVFVPAGYNKTFAELGINKNKISMRKIAIDNFRNYLMENYFGK